MSFLNTLPFLLVDGYNVIGACASLKQIRDQYSLDDARRELVESLINYSASVGYQTQVVFDAHYQNTPSYSENYTKHLSVYYTAFSETADTYIEKFCASFQRTKDKYSRLLVATSDRAQCLTATGYGAEWLSSQKLIVEIEDSSKLRKRHKRPEKQAHGRFLVNSLDPQAQQRLKDLLFQKG
jgi:predicted RNA-binding protein with PIN domain